MVLELIGSSCIDGPPRTFYGILEGSHRNAQSRVLFYLKEVPNNVVSEIETQNVIKKPFSSRTY